MCLTADDIFSIITPVKRFNFTEGFDIYAIMMKRGRK